RGPARAVRRTQRTARLRAACRAPAGGGGRRLRALGGCAARGCGDRLHPAGERRLSGRMKRFRIADAAFDTDALHARLRDSSAGACSVFEGWVRDHNDGRPVRGLRYESYVELAESEGERILEE